ncbi:MAG: glycosyltransferase [Aliidongia sp.]
MIRSVAGAVDRQAPFEVAIVLPTLLRPSLGRAVRSVFAQDFPGRLQILVGIDWAEGDRGQLTGLARDCPAHVALDVFDPGYSTSIRHGGLYPNHCSGALRTILSYTANSRYIAYLDDDNWWAPDHLSSLVAAIDGQDWSWSRRWFVEEGDEEPICVDDWESVGPGAGLYRERYGGFVDPSSLLIDKLACHHILPLWSLSPYEDGRGEDRLIFEQLKDRPQRGTGQPTSFYRMGATDPQHLVRLQLIRQSGAMLPSERRSGVIRLADLVEPALEPDRFGTESVGEDVAFGALLRLLRPAEAVILGAGSGEAALALAGTAQAIGLDCLFVAVTDAAEEHGRLGGRIAALGLGRTLRLLPELSPGTRLAVDLVFLGPERIGPAAWQAGFAILRPGGFLMGHGSPDGLLNEFVVTSGSNLLPFPSLGQDGWIVEKGLRWTG